jgi:putative nucleotidyltransferase with HDIG domain
MGKVTLQEIIAKVDRLPELPEALLRVTHMMEDPNVDAEDLAEVIRLDPSLTSQILRLCNSAAYGFTRRITTVKEAVAILGFNTLKSMIYTIISHITLNHPVEGYSLGPGDLWYNSLTCAVYARHITEYHRLMDPELGFTGAILRDIGKIVLDEYVGVNYQEIEELSARNRVDFVRAEEEVIGFNHTMVGMKIAEKWNFPDNLTKVIRYHHKPSTMPKQIGPQADVVAKLVGVVHLADTFTMMAGNGLGRDGMMYTLDYEFLRGIGINVQGSYVEMMMSKLMDLNSVVQSLADSFTSVQDV